MVRIVFGLIFIVLGVLVSTSKHRSPGESDSQMITMAIFFMFIPGAFLIKYGIASIFNKQEEKRKRAEELFRKEESKQKAKQMAECNHNFSSWSLKNVNPYYCGDHKVSQRGERICSICGKVETCTKHDIQFVNSDGSLYDHTDYYRCTGCGYEFHINYDI